MLTIVLMFDEAIIQHVTQFVDNIVMATIGWVRDGVADVPLDKYEDDVEDLLLERVPFWKCVNKTIREERPFMPIRIFRHSTQSFYAKTREGVDGNSQTRSVLKSSSTAHKLELKVVTHTFKTILVNAFVFFFFFESKHFIYSVRNVHSLETEQHYLNIVM